MDDSSYMAGQLNGFVFSASDGGSDNSGLDPYLNNMFMHGNTTDNLVFSPVIESRHESVALSPFQLSDSPPAQWHKAAFQPEARLMTPHLNLDRAYQSADMSREASYASHQSSISSGQHLFRDQQAQWYPNGTLSSGTSMRRTMSLNAGLVDQQSISAPTHHRMHSDHLGAGLTSVYSPASSDVVLDDAPYDAPSNNTVVDMFSNRAANGRVLGFGNGNVGPL